MRNLQITHLEQIDYRSALGLQHRLMEKRSTGEIADQLLLLEHPHTFTLGRTGRLEHLRISAEELSQSGIPLYQTRRGGNITYHGPGQLVGYPIIDLNGCGRDIGRYLRGLEQVLIRSMAMFNLKGEQLRGLTGVWVDGKKIASIGIAVRHWITYHGFSLNIDPDLCFFDKIVPCGLRDREVTSMRQLLGEGRADAEEVRWAVSKSFIEIFCSIGERPLALEECVPGP